MRQNRRLRDGYVRPRVVLATMVSTIASSPMPLATPSRAQGLEDRLLDGPVFASAMLARPTPIESSSGGSGRPSAGNVPNGKVLRSRSETKG